MQFSKPPLTYQEQIDLLISGGMRIDDHSRARDYLANLHYYRLPFEQDHATHIFKPGTSFEKVVAQFHPTGLSACLKFWSKHPVLSPRVRG